MAGNSRGRVRSVLGFVAAPRPCGREEVGKWRIGHRGDGARESSGAFPRVKVGDRLIDPPMTGGT
jgi:hypothetical protein